MEERFEFGVRADGAVEDEFAAGEVFDMSAIPADDEVDAAWCLRFLRAIRDVSFATVDADGKPSVRIIDVMMATTDRLYFLAPRGKAFHDDVMRERYVAIVGQTPDYRTCRLRASNAEPARRPAPSSASRRAHRMSSTNPTACAAASATSSAPPRPS